MLSRSIFRRNENLREILLSQNLLPWRNRTQRVTSLIWKSSLLLGTHLVSSRILSLPALQRLISKSSVCAKCRKGSLVVSEVSRVGMAPNIQLSCDACTYQTEEVSIQEGSTQEE